MSALPKVGMQIATLEAQLRYVFEQTPQIMLITEQDIFTAFKAESKENLDDKLRIIGMSLKEFMINRFSKDFSVVEDLDHRAYIRREFLRAQLSPQLSLTAPLGSCKSESTSVNKVAASARNDKDSTSPMLANFSNNRTNALPFYTPTVLNLPSGPSLRDDHQAVEQRMVELQKQFEDRGLEGVFHPQVLKQHFGDLSDLLPSDNEPISCATSALSRKSKPSLTANNKKLHNGIDDSLASGLQHDRKNGNNERQVLNCRILEPNDDVSFLSCNPQRTCLVEEESEKDVASIKSSSSLVQDETVELLEALSVKNPVEETGLINKLTQYTPMVNDISLPSCVKDSQSGMLSFESVSKKKPPVKQVSLITSNILEEDATVQKMPVQSEHNNALKLSTTTDPKFGNNPSKLFYTVSEGLIVNIEDVNKSRQEYCKYIEQSTDLYKGVSSELKWVVELCLPENSNTGGYMLNNAYVFYALQMYSCNYKEGMRPSDLVELEKKLCAVDQHNCLGKSTYIMSVAEMFDRDILYLKNQLYFVSPEILKLELWKLPPGLTSNLYRVLNAQNQTMIQDVSMYTGILNNLAGDHMVVTDEDIVRQANIFPLVFEIKAQTAGQNSLRTAFIQLHEKLPRWKVLLDQPSFTNVPFHCDCRGCLVKSELTNIPRKN